MSGHECRGLYIMNREKNNEGFYTAKTQFVYMEREVKQE